MQQRPWNLLSYSMQNSVSVMQVKLHVEKYSVKTLMAFFIVDSMLLHVQTIPQTKIARSLSNRTPRIAPRISWREQRTNRLQKEPVYRSLSESGGTLITQVRILIAVDEK